jgi:hypothetical protein
MKISTLPGFIKFSLSIKNDTSIIGFYTSKTGRSNNSRAAVVAHFDPDGIFDLPFLNYLKELSKINFDIYVVTTSFKIDSESLEQCLEIAVNITQRRNDGLDFASWAIAIMKYSILERYDSLLITNDSIIGPFTSLNLVIDSFDGSGNSLCGLTESMKREHHLQSYFIYFNKSIIKTAFIHDFWRSVKLLKSKSKIIKRYEIGLSKLVLQNGYNLKAMVPFSQIMEYCEEMGDSFQYSEDLKKNNLNPTLFMWDILIEHFKFPFLKRELLTQNRFKSKRIKDWADICLISSEREDEIQNYISRYKKGLKKQKLWLK